ncbi:hypothetical protein GCM10010282_38460 [Streptomyces roseolus]|nr:hypothetical protein GCM10010282_38460 [Streptomyces roseolus]
MRSTGLRGLTWLSVVVMVINLRMMIIALKWHSTGVDDLARGNPGDRSRTAWISRSETSACHIRGFWSVMEA